MIRQEAQTNTKLTNQVFTYLSQTPFDAITAQTPKLQNWWDEVSKLPTVERVCP